MRGVSVLNNEEMLKQAIELLKELDLTGAESVQINNTKYDDGSALFEVGVSYPAKDVIKTETSICIGNEVISVLTNDND